MGRRRPGALPCSRPRPARSPAIVICAMSRPALVAIVAAALFVTAHVASVAADAGRAATAGQPSAAVLDTGMKAYRQFCGQCHALKEARAVGFGSAKQKGVGQDGG